MRLGGSSYSVSENKLLNLQEQVMITGREMGGGGWGGGGRGARELNHLESIRYSLIHYYISRH